jgi:integrase
MVRRLRHVFGWAVEAELAPIEVYERLKRVKPLQPFRGGRETSGSRGPVSWELVERTLPFLPPLIRSFVVVAFHCGARVGELARLTTGQIDMTTDPWVVIPNRHKTAHKGKSRRILLGIHSQEALKDFLLPDQPHEPIFSPMRVDERQEKRQGKRLPGKTYSRNGLGQVLRRAIQRAGLDHRSWSLGQLRHSCAVNVTNSFGIETTRQLLGHANVEMSQHYASEADLAAREAARKLG